MAKDIVKIKVTETKTAILDLDPRGYPLKYRTAEGMIQYEKDGFDEVPGYMDKIKANSVVRFEVVGEAQSLTKEDDDWAVHINGPDDITGPYTEIEAHKKANEINKFWLKKVENDRGTPLCIATVLSSAELEKMDFKWDRAERRG
jgi:hypothetical protein